MADVLSEAHIDWLNRFLADEGLRFRRARHEQDEYAEARTEGAIDAIARVMFQFDVVGTDEEMAALVEQAKGVDDDF